MPSARSPDGAKRNPGVMPPKTPDYASLHPGYGVRGTGCWLLFAGWYVVDVVDLQPRAGRHPGAEEIHQQR
jgi:hypothetical protein